VFSGPSCQQDGDRYFERLQPAAEKLHVLVVVAAAAAVLLLLLLLFLLFEGISYVFICADEL
jgi:Cu/Ag efflux pump CusA